jgi:16S rRNA G1207 methylase RsmC
VAECPLPNRQLFINALDSLDQQFTRALVNCGAPKNHALLREMLQHTQRLLSADGIVLVAGPKKGGALVAERLLQEAYGSVALLEYRKGHRVYRASRPRLPLAEQLPADQPPEPPHRPLQLTIRGQQLQIIPDPRVFARGGLDPATAMLADAFEVSPGSQVLDLGAGTGLLGLLAAKLEPTSRCYLVDSDPLAVELATRNIALNQLDNASVHLSNVLAALPDVRFDLVLMNPPFHRDRRPDRSIAARFVEESRRALTPAGAIYVKVLRAPA